MTLENNSDNLVPKWKTGKHTLRWESGKHGGIHYTAIVI